MVGARAFYVYGLDAPAYRAPDRSVKGSAMRTSMEVMFRVVAAPTQGVTRAKSHGTRSPQFGAW